MSEHSFSMFRLFRPYSFGLGLGLGLWPQWPGANICDKWLAWTNAQTNLKEEVTSRSEEVPADDLSSIDKADLPKYIENYATIVESNVS